MASINRMIHTINRLLFIFLMTMDDGGKRRFTLRDKNPAGISK